MTPLRVLLVEDSPADEKLIVHELARLNRPLHHQRVEDEAQMRAALCSDWDIILSDWSLPRFSALAALALVTRLPRRIPFVIVSGTVGEETAVAAMRAGAHDYVLKDRLSRLVPVVEREVRDRAQLDESETARRASERRFARLAESGVVGIAFVDLSGAIEDANDKYLEILGYSRADLEAGAISWRAMTPPEHRSGDDRAIEQLNASGAAQPWEKELIGKDGKRVPVLVGVAMLEPPKCVAFIVDLTERKRTEKLLQETELQLRHAQKMEAIGVLAGGVAHDFNNLLTVILGFAQVLHEQVGSEDLKECVQEIQRAAERAASLTRQLLVFSRKQIVAPKVMNLRDVLRDMDRMPRRVIGEDVVMTSVLDAEGNVMIDPTNIEQVLMNLVVNARDAMPQGGRLTIETSDVDLDAAFVAAHVGAKPGPYVMLRVSDTGVGMDRATQARIFEPFFTTKVRGKGTGLGLSTVFGIVQQSEGMVVVDSQVGKGTTFTVYLPRVDAPVHPRSPDADKDARKGDETILLVEDDDSVRAAVSRMLARSGYRVLTAAHGEEALEVAGRHVGEIHLLLTDVVMPGMSGFDLARSMLERRPGVKLLCMSGYTDERVIHPELTSAGLVIVQKPVAANVLARAVREVLDAVD